MLMPPTFDACKIISEIGGGVLCWRWRGAMADAYLGAWWLAERSTMTGDVVIFVPASFGGQRGRRGHMLSHALPNQGGGVLCQCQCQRRRRKGKLAQIVRKCN